MLMSISRAYWPARFCKPHPDGWPPRVGEQSTRRFLSQFAVCLNVAGMAERKHVPDYVRTASDKRNDVMEFNFPTTATTGTAMAIAPQFGLPLFVGERASIPQKGAAFRCAALFIRSAVRCAPTLGGVLSILRLYGHAEVYHHHKKGETPWTRYSTTNSSGSSLAMCSIVPYRGAQRKTQTNSRFCLMRINSRSLPAAMRDSKFSLIDLNPAMGTRRKATSHRERLSERTSLEDDATVCSHGNSNHERAAEMTAPAL